MHHYSATGPGETMTTHRKRSCVLNQLTSLVREIWKTERLLSRKKVLLYFVLFTFICRLGRVKDAFTPITWQCHPTEWIGWNHLHSLISLSLRTHTGARHQWHLYPFEPLKEVLKFYILFLMCNRYREQLNVSKWKSGKGWAAFRASQLQAELQEHVSEYLCQSSIASINADNWSN